MFQEVGLVQLMESGSVIIYWVASERDTAKLKKQNKTLVQAKLQHKMAAVDAGKTRH